MTKLLTGDGIARIVGFITTPILTRIYLPEHMGVLSVFMALAMILAPFGTFRYSLAIPLPKNDGLALNIAILSFILLTAASFIILIIFFVFGNQILTFFSMGQLTKYWYLLPIVFIGTGYYELLSSWAIRKRAFFILAKTNIWQKVFGATTKILLGLIGLKPLGLLIGHIITQTGGMLTLSRSFRQNFETNIDSISKSRIKFLCKRYADFPKYRVPSQFLLALTSRAPLLFFAWYFSSEAAGQLGLAIMMLSLPITFIGYNAGKAYYGEIALIGKKNPEKILDITKNITQKLLMFSILPFLIIFIFSPWLFKVIFGELWYDAGVYARILSIYLLAQFLYSPISEGIFSVFEKQSMVLLLEIMRLIFIAIGFAISYQLHWSQNEVLVIYSIGLGIHYVISTYIAFKVIKRAILII